MAELPVNKVAQITRLWGSNFKTFLDFDVPLTPLTVLVGPNAAGKSNLIRALTFFRDSMKHGVDNALSMQGGLSAMRSAAVPKSESLTLGFEGTAPEPSFNLVLGALIGSPLVAREVSDEHFQTKYSITLRGTRSLRGYEIVSENLKLSGSFPTSPSGDEGREHLAERRTFSTELRRVANDVSLNMTQPNDDFGNLTEMVVDSIKHNQDLISAQFINSVPLIAALSTLKIFDFEPAGAKQATAITGIRDLEEDGDNLAIVLERILQSDHTRRRFLNLLNVALPDIEQLNTEKYSDETRIIVARERLIPRAEIPGFLLSDGTIDVVATLTALFFDECRLAVFEEPERHMHPLLVDRMRSLFEGASANKQVVLSTHSSRLLRGLDLDQIICLQRNKKGFSDAFKASTSAKLQSFSETMGIEKLHSDDLLPR